MKDLDNIWQLSQKSEKLSKEIATRMSTKHGMLATVPLICRAHECPYKASCLLDDDELEIGTRCPMEVGAIMSRFEHWCNHFGIEVKGNVINDEDLVDATLIRDLVDNEIQVLRAENRIAISADFISKVVATVDNKGKAFYKEELSAESAFKIQLLDKKYKILQLLNSTRKDKAKKERMDLSPSAQALGIFQKIQQAVVEKDGK